MDEIEKDLEEVCDRIEFLRIKYGDAFSCITFTEVDVDDAEDNLIAKVMNASVGNYDDFKYLFIKMFKTPVLLISALDAINDLFVQALKDKPILYKIHALKALELIKMEVTMDNPEIKKDIEERKNQEQASADVDEFLRSFYKGEAQSSSFTNI